MFLYVFLYMFQESYACEDNDADGILNCDTDGNTPDCDDTDPLIGTPEPYYRDSDGDGFGDSIVTILSCSSLPGYVLQSGDCDDSNHNINPSALEVCDSIDNNCDEVIDLQNEYYRDNDGDGFGDPNSAIVSCEVPNGFVSDNSDCDDSDSYVYPGATEIDNDEIDQNCDGVDGYTPIASIQPENIMTGDDITCDFGGNQPEFEVTEPVCELHLDADTAFHGTCPLTINLQDVGVSYDNEDEITCTVTLSTGNLSFQGSVKGLLHNNQAPEFSSDPHILYGNDGNLYCDVDGISDPDGDPLSFEFLWFLNNENSEPISEGDTLTAELNPTDVEEIICLVTADDGLAQSTATTSKSVAALTPSVSSAIQSNLTDDALVYSCTHLAVTPEGLSFDALSIEYAWYREGDYIPLFLERDFPLTYFTMEYYELEPPNRLECTVTVYVGLFSSSDTSEITIEDVPPSLKSVSNHNITTQIDASGTTLTCSSESEEITFSLYEMEIQAGDILSFDIESISETICEGTIQIFIDDAFYTYFEGSEDVHHFEQAFWQPGNLRVGWLNADGVNNEGCKFSISEGNNLLYESPQRPISFELQPPLEEIFYQYQWIEGGDIDSQVYLSEDASLFLSEEVLSLPEIQCKATACLEEGCPNPEQTLVTTSYVYPNEYIDPTGNSEIPEIEAFITSDVEGGQIFYTCDVDVLTEGVTKEDLNLTYMWEYTQGEGNNYSHQFLTEGQYLTLSQQDFINYGLSIEGELECSLNGVYNSVSLYEVVATNVSEIPNTAPYFINDISLEPSEGITIDSNVSCSVQVEDDEQAYIEVEYTWHDDQGNDVFDGEEIPLSSIDANSGDTFTCQARAEDILGEVAETSISFTIDNTPPFAVQDPEIELIEQAGLFFFTCDALFMDLENQELTTQYNWYVGWNTSLTDEENMGLLEPIATGDVLILSKEDFENFEISIDAYIACVVTAEDSDEGVSSSSDYFIIESTPDEPPFLGPVMITTNKDYAVGSTLTCEATAEDDEDGVLSPEYTWKDAVYNIVSTQQELLLTPENSHPEQMMYCFAEVTDSAQNTSYQASGIEIFNAPPTFTEYGAQEAEITVNGSPNINSSLECYAQPVDPDGEENLEISYVWKNVTQGNEIGTDNFLELAMLGVNPNDIIECKVNVVDVRGGTAESEDQIVIENRSPEADNIEIQVAGSGLLCNAFFSDPDYDNFDVTYEWKRIEPVLEIFDQTNAFLDLSSLNINGGDIIKCYSTATDTWGGFSEQSTTIEIGFQDNDLDGLMDDEEEIHSTDPNNADSDGDGLLDGEEVYQYETQPDNNDSDGDGLFDGEDIFCDPHVPDIDGDGIGDWREGTADLDEDGIINCLDDDSDDDGLLDFFEGEEDVDGDGLINSLDIDSDGDGLLDSFEGVDDSDDDGIPDLWDEDSDNDGISDFDEGKQDIDSDGLGNYVDTESDGDGIDDEEERALGTDPFDSDTDGDGASDGDELIFNTDPLRQDTDGDGLLDGEEIHTYETNPLEIDSDSDKAPDKDEVDLGTDPNDPNDFPTGVFGNGCSTIQPRDISPLLLFILFLYRRRSSDPLIVREQK